MDIQLNCPKCTQPLTANQSAAGTTIKCPKCSAALVVPVVGSKRAKKLALAALVLGIIVLIPMLLPVIKGTKEEQSAQLPEIPPPSPVGPERVEPTTPPSPAPAPIVSTPTPSPAPPTPEPTRATPQPPTAPPQSVASAILALKSASTEERYQPLRALTQMPVEPDKGDELIAALKPLLYDEDHGELAFQLFAEWASTKQVPDLIEFVSTEPQSERGQESMKILARLGDARAAEPLAACLANVQTARDAKAALIALGSRAEPAVIPHLKSADATTRKRAAEVLAKIGTAQSLPALEVAAQDSNSAAGAAAATAISAIRARP